MLNGIPIWQHLKNNGSENAVQLKAQDYGHLAERIGRRAIVIAIRENNLLNQLFPDVKILSWCRVNNIGDYSIELSYKLNEKYGKKAIVFEIKHGKIQIRQNQLKKYCNMIHAPSNYFNKADEVRIIYLLFDRIDTLSEQASYKMCELNKDLALKISTRTSTMQFTDIDSSIEGFFRNF